MRDRVVILAGLALFLAAASLPVWYNAAAGTVAKRPEPKRAAEPRCVEPPATMRAGHMQLLVGWREQVVRDARRTYVASDGRSHAVSLEQTCMRCHGDKADFCDRCHDYAAVRIGCWDCHVDRGAVKRGGV